MANVLFVKAAEALYASRLRALQPTWRMRFMPEMQGALQALHEEPADAVVVGLDSDVTGIELLARVRDHWPATVRLVLSAETTSSALMQALPVAHQCFKQPFDPVHLLREIQHACRVQSYLYSPGLMAALGALKSLPSVPKIYRQLTQELDGGNASVRSVAQIIEQDVSMTLRLLQLVNSAYLGAPRRITTIRDAVNFLGFEAIRSLVLSTQLFRAMSQICSPVGFSLDAVQQHSIRVAEIAAGLLTDRERSREAYSAAILHDVGRVALAVCMPEAYAATLALSQREALPLHEAERAVLNATHAELGAYLLTLWGLPRSLVEAVAFHHQPALLDPHQLGVVGAIHVADAIDHRLIGMPGDVDAGSLARLDTGYIDRLGLSDQLPQWIAQRHAPRAAPEGRAVA